MPRGRGLFGALLGALLLTLLLAPVARAEFYLSGYLGASITQSNDVKFKDDSVIPPFPFTLFDLTLRNVGFDTSLMGGGKVGYWIGPLPNLGIEADVYHFSADVGNQSVTATGRPMFTLPVGLGFRPAMFAFGPVDRADIAVTALGFHVVGRLRLSQSSAFPNGRFQPYLGAGPGIFFSNVRLKPFTNQSDSDTSVGVQALGGLKFFFHKNFSVFAEYKFSHFNLDTKFATNFATAFSGTSRRSTTFSTDLNTHHVYGGAAVHFDLF